jgi:hypothetical protein
MQSLRATQFQPRGESCVLFTADPFYPDWDTYFLGKLAFNDRTVRVQMKGPKGDVRGDQCPQADYRLIMNDGLVSRVE